MELIYVLFLVSGLVKGILRAYNVNLPIDITLVLSLVLSIQLFIVIFVKKRYFERDIFICIIWILLFYVWFMCSFFYTPSPTNGIVKVSYFLLNILAFVYLVLNWDRICINKVFIFFIAITIPLNLLFIIAILPYIYIIPEFYEIRGLYLWVAIFSGINLIVVTFNYLSLFKLSILKYVVILINIFTLFSSGSRGGIVFFVMIFVIYNIYKIVKIINNKKIYIRKKTLFNLISIILMLPILHNYIYNNMELYETSVNRSIERLELLFDYIKSGGGDSSISDREKMINFTLDKIGKNVEALVIGYGVASFPIMYKGQYEEKYPHNILLEIWFETGLIGLLIFLSWISYILFRYFNEGIFWIFIYVFLNLLKSHSLYDIRLFFSIIALFAVATKQISLLTKNGIYKNCNKKFFY